LITTMPQALAPSDQPAIRLVMMPSHANPQGSIFGGVILSMIDQAAYVEAMRHADHRWVTVAMDSIEFHEPVHVGDVLSLWAETIRIGRTSLRAHITVKASRPGERTDRQVTQGEVVLVATDVSGKPTAVLGS
jgi:acyl-CoA thioesterase YciA